jgi:hypothetical protein
MNASAIIGAGSSRRESDFYPTPPECTKVLVRFLKEKALLRDNDVVWEPACGNNAIVDVLAHYNKVYATDIRGGFDFLLYDLPDPYDWIITNPPFCLSEQFIKKAYESNKPFAFLLKSQYWHSKKRSDVFHKCRPAYILPLTWRPDFTGQGNSLMDVMWVVWIGDAEFTQYLPLSKEVKK